MLVHDPEILSDPGIADAVARAARLAAANARLQRDVRAQAAELEASAPPVTPRGRCGAAAPRAPPPRGAELRLAGLAAELERARLSASGDAPASLDQCRAPARERDRGVGGARAGLASRLLSERGLEGALAELAQRSVLPVEVSSATGRLSEELEAAVYFVCSEALANAAKHASATKVSIEVTARDGELTVRSSTTAGEAPTWQGVRAARARRPRRGARRRAPHREPAGRRHCRRRPVSARLTARPMVRRSASRAWPRPPGGRPDHQSEPCTFVKRIPPSSDRQRALKIQSPAPEPQGLGLSITKRTVPLERKYRPAHTSGCPFIVQLTRPPRSVRVNNPLLFCAEPASTPTRKNSFGEIKLR